MHDEPMSRLIGYYTNSYNDATSNHFKDTGAHPHSDAHAGKAPLTQSLPNRCTTTAD